MIRRLISPCSTPAEPTNGRQYEFLQTRHATFRIIFSHSSHQPRTTLVMERSIMTSNPSWERPSEAYHAHFDCFSGAAGDMMLAACLDAASSDSLLPYIQHCLELGMPELAGEFHLTKRQVWRSNGSIAACHVQVVSKYQHEAAPAPQPAGAEEGEGHSHSHEHSHHHHHSHSHSASSLDTTSSVGEHNHSHHHDSSKGPLRNLPQIAKLLEVAPTIYIPDWVKTRAIEAFTALAEAEATTHGASSIESVHFHEVGAIDSIVDTVGTCLALYCLGVETVTCSRLPLGEGMVWTDHGLLPVPAPATLRLMKNMPTCPGPPGITGELVTPTAAALLRVLAKSYPRIPPGRPPCFTIRKIGIGAGTKDFPKHPNVIRLLIGNDVLTDERR